MYQELTYGKLQQRVRQLEEEALQHEQIKRELRYRSQFARLITATSTNFINVSPERIDKEINATLQKIGEFAEADRSYIFLFGEGKQLDNTHEWCSKAVKPQLHRLTGLSTDQFKWSMDKIRTDEVFYVPCVGDLPIEAAAEKAEFESENIQSLVNVPMTYKGNIVGFLGLDFVRMKKSLGEDIISLLKIVGEIIAGTLEHRRINEVLQKSEEKFRALVEATSDWVWEIDLNGVYTYTNPNVKNILGFEPEEIIGKAVFSTLKPDAAKRARKGFNDMVVQQKRMVMEEYTHINKDGNPIIVETSAEPFFDVVGNLMGFRGIDRNITERKRMEDELRKARDEL